MAKDDWTGIEDVYPEHGGWSGGMELAPAVLLLELPIAIHREEGTLRDFRYLCFPDIAHNKILLNPGIREHEPRAAC